MESDPLGAGNTTWRSLIIIGIVSTALPEYVAMTLSMARLGRCNTAITFVVPESVVTRAPADWELLNECEERIWIGVTLRRYSPAGYPDCSDCDVAYWQIQAGWPFRCTEAQWEQDYRFSWIVIQGSSPFELSTAQKPCYKQYHLLSNGLNPPLSNKHAPSAGWMPIMPIAAGYAGNVTLYYLSLLGCWKCLQSLMRRWVITKRIRNGLCPSCGYPNAGLTQPYCPECGGLRPAAGGTEVGG